jgi:hypothetical protein
MIKRIESFPETGYWFLWYPMKTGWSGRMRFHGKKTNANLYVEYDYAISISYYGYLSMMCSFRNQSRRRHLAEDIAMLLHKGPRKE